MLLLVKQIFSVLLSLTCYASFSVLGDPRTNQNPAMVTFGILLLRWHNVVAARVHRQHPDWSDEQLFQRARRIVIASLQVIRIALNFDANYCKI